MTSFTLYHQNQMSAYCFSQLNKYYYCSLTTLSLKNFYYAEKNGFCIEMAEKNESTKAG